MKRKALMASILTLVLGAGCKKDEGTVEEHTHVGGNTIASLQFNWQWGAAAFDASQQYTTNLGEPIRFNRVRFFVGQPSFNDDNGNLVQAFPQKYLLIDKDNGGLIQNIGEVNGHLHTMHMILGVDSATNHVDPATNAAPLDDQSMHWGWNPALGYIFYKLEGRYDSDNDGDVDNDDNPFVYHCGPDVMRRNTTFNVHTDALTGGSLIIDLTIDMQQTVNNLDIESDPFEDTVGPMTTQVMDNLLNAITYE